MGHRGSCFRIKTGWGVGGSEVRWSVAGCRALTAIQRQVGLVSPPQYLFGSCFLKPAEREEEVDR